MTMRRMTILTMTTAVRMIDDRFGGNAEEEISKSTAKIISELSSFTVFYNGGIGRPASKAYRGFWVTPYTLMQKAVADNQPLIEERVKAIINESGAENDIITERM